MRSQYAEEYHEPLVTNHKPTDVRRKSSDISSAALSVIVIGEFGLKRAGTAIKCKDCGLLVAPKENSEHQLTCAIKKIDLKSHRKSGNKRSRWIRKCKDKSISAKSGNNNNEETVNGQSDEIDGSEATLDERPRTATLDGPSVLDLNELTSVDMTLSVKALNANPSLGDDPISRPETVTLLRPTPNLNIPNIHDNNDKSSVPLKRETPTPRRQINKTTKGRTRAKRGSIKIEHQISKHDSAINLEEKLPVPCKTCERSKLPERLHSHGTSDSFKANLTTIKRRKKVENLPTVPKSNHKKLILNTSQRSSNRTKTQKSFSILKSASSTNLAKTSKSKSATSKKKPNVQSYEKKNNSVPAQPVNTSAVQICEPSVVPLKTAKDPSNQFELSSASGPVTDRVTRNESDVVHEEKQHNSKVSDSSKHPSKRGPPTLLCYICGREFGTKSLQLHEPHCLEKWHRENAKLPENMRRPVPQKPDINYKNASREEQNDAAWHTFSSQLSACPICNRTFFPDRLPVHMKACKGKDGGKNQAVPSSETKKLKPKNISRVPPSFVTCYICGRDYGTHSIGLHEPHCLEKWRNENNKLPAELQRQEPVKPDLQYADDGNVDVEATRNALWQSHLNQLVPCTNCGRTFYPDRLEAHQRHCKANSFIL